MAVSRMIEPMKDQKSTYPGITPAIATQGIEHALRMMGGRWKLNILFELFGGRVLRFNELEHAIAGITQKMLSQQLRALGDDGLVERKLYAEVPPRVEYRLTAMGEALCPALDELLYWAQRWAGEPTQAATRDTGSGDNDGNSLEP